MQGLRRPSVKAVAVAGALVCTAMPAAAHPHMCVELEATVLYEKGAFTGLEQKWTFHDERYIAEAVEGLDKNKDGRLDRSELGELAKVNVESLQEFDYFTIAVVATQPVKVAGAKDYWMEHTANALSLHFTVPFAAPVPVGDKALEFIVRDPENFIAFGVQKAAAPVRLGSGTPKRCRVTALPLKGEEEQVLKPILEAIGCTITVPKAISIACDGP
jgi:ABC-type uncharacterized transport system substrate-binding protein